MRNPQITNQSPRANGRNITNNIPKYAESLVVPPIKLNAHKIKNMKNAASSNRRINCLKMIRTFFPFCVQI
jgi:hypothetical protein